MSTQSEPLAYIVEDDDQLSDIFSQAMKMAGFATIIEGDGQQALNTLATLEPAVVVLDVYLPGVSGDKILYYIRSQKRFQKVIIVLTTFDSLLADSLREKSDYVMLKPVSFSQLRDLGLRLRTSIE